METKQKISNELERIEEDALYSAKGHFCAARIWKNIHYFLGIPSAAMAAMVGATILSDSSGDNLVAGWIALLVAVVTGVHTFINPNQKSERHHIYGNYYNALKNNARLFREIELPTSGETAEAIETIKKLNDQRNKLNLESPQIPRWAFLNAKKGIEDGEAEYQVDNETPI